MSWASFLVLLVKAVLAAVTYLQQTGAIEAGKAEAVQEHLGNAIEALQVANAARAAVSDDAASVYNDPDNRSRGKGNSV